MNYIDIDKYAIFKNNYSILIFNHYCFSNLCLYLLNPSFVPNMLSQNLK